MIIRKNIVIKWAGNDVVIKNTMSLANSLEMSGFNLLWLYSQLSQPVLPPVAAVSSFLAELLSYGDDMTKPVSPDDVMAAIVGDMSEEGRYLTQSALNACELLMPTISTRHEDADTKKKPKE